MPENKRMTTRLKELFERPEVFVLPGGMNPMGAKMAELLGFEAFYMSGGNTSAQVLGLTEGGTSIRDMVDNARRITMTVDIPAFVDMDTGYGDAVTVYQTVKEYIRGGIAGTHLEDQTYPPKSGPRRRCVSIEEMVGKLLAAMDAKMELDPDFVIVARCDYAGVPGAKFEEVMERCLAYKRETNVDVVCPAVNLGKITKKPFAASPGRSCPCLPTGARPTQHSRSCKKREPPGPGIRPSPAWQDYKPTGTCSATSRTGVPAPWMISCKTLPRANGAPSATAASSAHSLSGRWKISILP